MELEDRIQLALSDFYQSQNKEKQKAAHEFLLAVQQDVETWPTMVELLAHTDDKLVHFYATNCLMDFLRQRWTENMDQLLLPIRDSLLMACDRNLNSFEQFGGRSKLLSALALCVLRSAPDVWPDSVDDLVSFFAGKHAPVELFTLLSSLPEEFMRFTCQPERRIQVRYFLEDCQTRMLKLLDSFSWATDDRLLMAMLLCAKEWMQFSSNLDDWHSAISHCLACYSKPILLSAVQGFFCVLVEHLKLQDYENLLTDLYKFCHLLRCQYLTADRLDFLNESSPPFRVITMINYLAENHTNWLLANITKDGFILEILDTLLMASQAPGQYPLDEMISGTSHTMWYTLAVDVMQVMHEKQEWWPLIEHTFRKLFKIIMVKSRIDQRMLAISRDSEEWEQFISYREGCTDLLQSCFKMFRPHLGDDVLADLQAMTVDQETATARWLDIEAVYFFYGAIGEIMSTYDAQALHMDIVFQLMSKLPKQTLLTNTLLDGIKNLGHVVTELNLFSIATEVVTLGLLDQRTLTKAVSALNELKEQSRDDLAPWADQLLSALMVWLQDATMSETKRIRVMSCYGKVLSMKGMNEVTPLLEPILSPILQRLRSICNGQLACAKVDVLRELRYVTVIFDALGKQGAPDEILASVCDLIEPLYNCSRGDSDMAEQLCRLMMSILNIVQDRPECLITFAWNLMYTLFPPHGCVMKFLSKMFLLLDKDNGSMDFMVAMFTAITERTSTVVAADTDKDDVAVLECYLIFATDTYGRHWKLLDNQLEAMGRAVELAMAGLKRAENGILRQSCNFFSKLFKRGNLPGVTNLVQRFGVAIANECFQRLMVEELSISVEYICDVLYPLCKMYGQALTEFFAHLPNDPMVSNMMKQMDSRRLFVRSARAYNISCRRRIATSNLGSVN